MSDEWARCGLDDVDRAIEDLVAAGVEVPISLARIDLRCHQRRSLRNWRRVTDAEGVSSWVEYRSPRPIRFPSCVELARRWGWLTRPTRKRVGGRPAEARVKTLVGEAWHDPYYAEPWRHYRSRRWRRRFGTPNEHRTNAKQKPNERRTGSRATPETDETSPNEHRPNAETTPTDSNAGAVGDSSRREPDGSPLPNPPPEGARADQIDPAWIESARRELDDLELFGDEFEAAVLARAYTLADDAIEGAGILASYDQIVHEQLDRLIYEFPKLRDPVLLRDPTPRLVTVIHNRLCESKAAGSKRDRDIAAAIRTHPLAVGES